VPPAQTLAAAAVVLAEASRSSCGPPGLMRAARGCHRVRPAVEPRPLRQWTSRPRMGPDLAQNEPARHHPLVRAPAALTLRHSAKIHLASRNRRLSTRRGGRGERPPCPPPLAARHRHHHRRQQRPRAAGIWGWLCFRVGLSGVAPRESDPGEISPLNSNNGEPVSSG
jgi:hypothetical protein